MISVPTRRHDAHMIGVERRSDELGSLEDS